MQTRIRILLAIALLLILAVLAEIMYRQIPPRIDLPYDITSTGLAMEFAKNTDEILTLIGIDRRYAPAIQALQYWDFAFIPCYVALFVLMGRTLRDYDVPGAAGLSWAAVILALAAGAADIAENVSILRTARDAARLTSDVRWFSLPKWALVFTVMLIESAVFFFWPRLILWWRIGAVVVGLLFLFAGGAGLLFTSLVSIPDIARAASWITWALMASLVFLIGRAFHDWRRS